VSDLHTQNKVTAQPNHFTSLRGFLAALDQMNDLVGAGAIIAPPVPAFYTRPSTLHDMIDQTVGRVLDLFGIDTATFPRWGESCPVTSGIQPCAAASTA
jgi:hypothetical protein